MALAQVTRGGEEPVSSARPAAVPAALRYTERGWSVIPVDGTSKMPLVPWRNFIDRRPTVEEIQSWSMRFRGAGIAVITGPVSKIVVLDADGAEGVAEARRLGVPKTPTVHTPRGGAHFYFRLPDGLPTAFKNAIKLGESKKLDVRGHAGYVVAPFTKRADGKRYEWVLDPEKTELAEPPEWFIRLLRAHAKFPPSARIVRQAAVRREVPVVSDEVESFIGTLPPYTQRMIREGHDLVRFKSKSECDFGVILMMLAAGADETLIEQIYSSFPIGEKYQDVKYGAYYLNRTIDEALQRIRVVHIKYADPIAYDEARLAHHEPGVRVHIAFIVEQAPDAGRMIRFGLTMPDAHRSGGNFAARWAHFFDAAKLQAPTNYEETRLACRALIGRKMRVLLDGRPNGSNPISAFYAV